MCDLRGVLCLFGACCFGQYEKRGEGGGHVLRERRGEMDSGRTASRELVESFPDLDPSLLTSETGLLHPCYARTDAGELDWSCETRRNVPLDLWTSSQLVVRFSASFPRVSMFEIGTDDCAMVPPSV